jgi:excinuclease ABC subunit A
VIKTADWIVDHGPEGGDAGGHVVAVGTPQEIAANPASYTPASYTGQHLKQIFDRRRSGKTKRAPAAPE